MIFPAYKANRDATPEAIKLQFLYSRITALYSYYRSKGYETDDLIGTIAKQTERELQSLWSHLTKTLRN
jgi:DNA polymerase-1